MKILIAEDDFVCRTLLQEILAEQGVCHVAVDGLEAMAAYRNALEDGKPFDLICLDIMMPGLDGQQVLQEIRKIEQERNIGGKEMVKVIMTTALADSKNIMRAFIKGSCESYLIKPIDKDKLLAEIKKLGLSAKD
ncbi:MAG: response regulator [Proteobacteria bacterium]|nr:response regulator [Pseudomonadota bacterium]MBU1717070.1 response regulator [Pseudomonadota bacterium]